MTHEITIGTILIKDNAVLPKELRFESEPCVPGWRLVNDFDGSGLDREVRKTGWIFFCLAGEVKATVFGIDRQKMVRRAIERILANPGSEDFNSMEITASGFRGLGTFPAGSLCDCIRSAATHSGKPVSRPREHSYRAGDEKRAPQSSHRSCERRVTAFTRSDATIRCCIDLKPVIT